MLGNKIHTNASRCPTNRQTKLLFVILLSTACISILYAFGYFGNASVVLDADDYTYVNQNSIMTNYLSRLEYAPMHAYKSEITEFMKQVKGKDTYVEWGSGGSTEMVPFVVNEHAYSMEHAIPWCKRMVTELHSIHVAVSFHKLSYHCVDTKVPLRRWGDPDTTDEKKIATMGDIYVNYIDHLGPKTFDVVFIDGRFRVACALKIIKEQYYHQDTVVMIHDYTKREHYTVVERYYDTIKCVDRL
eukprot:321359_1